MIKGIACLVLAAVAVGALAGMALDTFLGDPTWLVFALALFALDAVWKWVVKRRRSAQRRESAEPRRAPWDEDIARYNIRRAEQERARR